MVIIIIITIIIISGGGVVVALFKDTTSAQANGCYEICFSLLSIITSQETVVRFNQVKRSRLSVVISRF